MSDIMIDVNNVSIRFNLEKEKVNSIKEYFIRRLKGQIQYDEFWALKNVSFQVERGDSVGLVGLNGSGKSTLLKTIAGVLKPTEGSVRIFGSVAPLIELGAGFDFDLTGRENVFLNGAILGYSRKQMMEYYDDIVEFSEPFGIYGCSCEKLFFRHAVTPCFCHSNHRPPDILIVDEVLSVGDFRFQLKCEERIKKMMGKDTTVLFVSHSMEQVKTICKHAIWLEKGHIKMIGTAEEIGRQYEMS